MAQHTTWLHEYHEDQHMLTITMAGNVRPSAQTSCKIYIFDEIWGDPAFAANELSEVALSSLEAAQEILEEGTRIAIIDQTTCFHLDEDAAYGLVNYLQTVLHTHLIIVSESALKKVGAQERHSPLLTAFKALNFESIYAGDGDRYLTLAIDLADGDSCRFL